MKKKSKAIIWTMVAAAAVAVAVIIILKNRKFTKKKVTQTASVFLQAYYGDGTPSTYATGAQYVSVDMSGQVRFQSTGNINLGPVDYVGGVDMVPIRKIFLKEGSIKLNPNKEYIPKDAIEE